MIEIPIRVTCGNCGAKETIYVTPEEHDNCRCCIAGRLMIPEVTPDMLPEGWGNDYGAHRCAKCEEEWRKLCNSVP